jgi:hypothetical protein
MVERFQRNRGAVGLSFVFITTSSRRCPGQAYRGVWRRAPGRDGDRVLHLIATHANELLGDYLLQQIGLNG